jgi:hypothetical protein
MWLQVFYPCLSGIHHIGTDVSGWQGIDRTVTLFGLYGV